ncbi:AvrD family protein [Citrobacter portucalensis]|uniref:AvrD family protein n=1 Tax=Citrobacter portucalensis TaxID=1639133 RepID=UPI00226B2388|nr:AvrD family protein [Citrobacter portucalensis]MCX8985930.1 AvrD family protein [Citrobacter portucalensis]
MESSQIFSSINDILGPSEKRFFSSGYRRSEHCISNLVLCASGERQYCVEAMASISYPHDWSVKNHAMDVRPHLSTIDMLILAINMIESYLVCCFSLSPEDVQNICFGEIAIHAGTKPQENLTDIPITVKLRHSEPKFGDPSRTISTYECNAGRMRAVCQVEYPCGDNKSGEFRYSSMSDILGEVSDRYYHAGYKEQKHVLSNVNLNMENLTASSNVEIIRANNSSCDIRPGTASYIDVFVTCSQLAQALLYSLDGLTRSDTSTLWMIRTNFSENEKCFDVENNVKANVTISSNRLINLNGNEWRNVDVVGFFGGKVAKITFAHALPSTICD